MRIAFAGNPNSGKTTMYNALTGRNEKVGNWAGVTVDKKEAPIKRSFAGEQELIAVDLLDGGLFLVNGNTRPVADLFIAAGQCVVHGGLTGVGIACKSNSHDLDSSLK